MFLVTSNWKQKSRNQNRFSLIRLKLKLLFVAKHFYLRFGYLASNYFVGQTGMEPFEWIFLIELDADRRGLQ